MWKKHHVILPNNKNTHVYLCHPQQNNVIRSFAVSSLLLIKTPILLVIFEKTSTQTTAALAWLHAVDLPYRIDKYHTLSSQHP